MTWTCGPIGVPSPSVFTDDFERSDRTLDDNGWFPWGLNNGTPDVAFYPQIVSDRMTLPGLSPGSAYALRRVRGLSKITVSARFAAGSTNGSKLGIVASSRQLVRTQAGVNAVGLNSVHIAANLAGRELSLYQGSTSAAVDTDLYSLSTATDYTFSIEQTDPWTVLITDFDGGSESVGGEGTANGELIRALWGESMFVQVLNTAHATDKLLSINSVTVEGDTRIVLEGHQPMSWDGDEVTLEADLSTKYVEDAIAVRDLFNGMDLNVDLDAVSVTSSEDPSVDSYARIQQTSVDDGIGTHLPGGLGSIVNVEMIRVQDARLPSTEVRTVGADRATAASVTPDSWVGIPGAAVARAHGGESSPLVGGGTVIYNHSEDWYDSDLSYACRPEDSENASVRLVLNDYTWCGRQVPAGAEYNWSLSNGLVRVRPSLTESNHFIVGVRNSAATDFDEKAYRFGFASGADRAELGFDGTNRDEIVGLSILRLSQESATLRVVYGITAYQVFGGSAVTDFYVTAYLDFTLRRSQFYVEGRLSGLYESGVQWGIWRATTDAGTSITAGIEDNSADAAGNKWQIYAPARTADTTNGGLFRSSAGDDLPFAIGNDRAIFSGVTLSDSYFAAMDHNARIVPR